MKNISAIVLALFLQVVHAKEPIFSTQSEMSDTTYQRDLTENSDRITEYFYNPMLGGVRLDWCKIWGGKDCGLEAASAYCKLRGYEYLIEYGQDMDMHSTRLIGGRKCNGSYCTGFKLIYCGMNSDFTPEFDEYDSSYFDDEWASSGSDDEWESYSNDDWDSVPWDYSDSGGPDYGSESGGPDYGGEGRVTGPWDYGDDSGVSGPWDYGDDSGFSGPWSYGDNSGSSAP